MKPYPKYKPSGIEWIGEIPEHWDIFLVRRIIKSHKQGFYSNEEYTQDGCKLLRITDIDDNSNIHLSDCPRVSISQKEYEDYELQLNDFVFARSGTIGRFGIYRDNNLEVIFASYLIRFRFEENISVDFLKNYFLSNIFREGLISDLHGGANKNIHAENIKNQIICLPSYAEQTAIANYLDRKTAQIDDLIAKKQRLIELLNEEKTALINRAVTKGLNPDAPLKDSDIPWLGEIPAHWEVIRLKWIADINPSKGSSSFDKNSNELVTFLPMEKVSEDNSFDNSLKKPICELWSGFTYFEEGDVIVAKITPCFENGKGALLEKLGSNIGFGSTEFHVLRASQNVQRKFLFYLTRTELFKNMGEALMYGAAGQKRVPTSYLEEYVMALPPIEEQDLIVHHIEANLSRITDTISKIQREIDLLQEYRTALISEAVTGKIDVRDEAIEWQKI
ncbi:MAG: restriction endonuclease subunit S [Calditrichaceae bacterium]|nr:restriction endonuclease subunit S [Calditrichaceae bacterium]